MRLGRIVEGGAIRDRLEFGKTDSTEPYSTSRSAAAWDEFLAELSKSGTGLDEISSLKSKNCAIGLVGQSPQTQTTSASREIYPKLSRTRQH
jgi:hypothetical protein